MKSKSIVLALAIITTGLTAGLFFGFSVAIIPAFERLSDVNYIAAMQAIDAVIENPVFLLAFMGAAVLLPITAYQHRSKSKSPTLRFKLLVISALLYVIGCFGVTMTVNVPLNDKLAAFDYKTAMADAHATARKDYEGPWNNWHQVRALASIAAFIVAISAVTVRENNQVNAKGEA